MGATPMTDLPAIMSAPMVLATLREIAKPGTGKTETRRLAWGRWLTVQQAAFAKGPIRVRADDEHAPAYAQVASVWQKLKPGDRLYVKEAISIVHGKVIPGADDFIYAADNSRVSADTYSALRHREIERGKPYKNLGSRYVPKVATRITLIVTGARVERLQEINNASCIAEGAEIEDVPGGSPDGQPMVRIDGKSWHHQTVRLWYHRLWDSLHGEGAWDENPEVVVVSFRPVLKNIEAM